MMIPLFRVVAAGILTIASQPAFARSPIRFNDFDCSLPAPVKPASDGLPSAEHLFSSRDALSLQVRRHQAIVRVPTVCYDDLGNIDDDRRWGPFHELHNVLRQTYPIVHERAKLEKVNTFGLVYTIQGSNPSLKPILLTAHQDVVPVADEASWTYPPFDAHFDGEWLWGRGALDDKDMMTAILSTLETLLSYSDWRPSRTVVVAFGFDEECGGSRGASQISVELARQYGEGSFAMVYDEGGLGLQQLGNVLYALPAVYEKGYIDIWFELSVVGGHSSTPVPHTSIGIVAQLINRLEQNPFRPKIIGNSPTHRHLQCQARYSRDADTNLTHLIETGDLDGAAKVLSKAGVGTHYLITTSQAVDYITGGQKINALPEITSLGVNYRIAPQDSILSVQQNAVKLAREVASEYGIRVKAFEGDQLFQQHIAGANSLILPNGGSGVDANGTLVISKKQCHEATSVSPTEGAVWDIFAGTIRYTYEAENNLVVPAGEAMTGNTDGRHYSNLSPNVYRWRPIKPFEYSGLHTVDERILMTGHMQMLKFYYNLIRNFDSGNTEQTGAVSSEL